MPFSHERADALVRAGAHPAAAAALEQLVSEGADEDLFRLNAFSFAARGGIGDDMAIDVLLNAVKLGHFDISWDVTCPGCGDLLDAAHSLKTITRDTYPCRKCLVGFQPTLDDLIEVSFTVNPRVRRVAGHDPDALDLAGYYKLLTFGTRVATPDDRAWRDLFNEIHIDGEPVPAGEKVILSVRLPAERLIVFDPVVHGATHLVVQGEPAVDRQELGIVFSRGGASPEQAELRPGPARIVLQNKTDRRIYPAIVRYDHPKFQALMGSRRPFLTAKRLLTHQTFYDLFHTDALDLDQRLRVTNLTVLFTDLKGSTELYERVGDLVAYDLVKKHFAVLADAVRAHGGATVKTIGDAVMATFPSPDRGLSAALDMRTAMTEFNRRNHPGDLTVKIGLHEGPCLAVVLNERLDYFGQTVNIAARVQGLATSQSIFTTSPVVMDPDVKALLSGRGLQPRPQQAMLKGIRDELTVYEIP